MMLKALCAKKTQELPDEVFYPIWAGFVVNSLSDSISYDKYGTL
jgi:hypothetical protein